MAIQHCQCAKVRGAKWPRPVKIGLGQLQGSHKNLETNSMTYSWQMYHFSSLFLPFQKEISTFWRLEVLKSSKYRHTQWGIIQIRLIGINMVVTFSDSITATITERSYLKHIDILATFLDNHENYFPWLLKKLTISITFYDDFMCQDFPWMSEPCS